MRLILVFLGVVVEVASDVTLKELDFCAQNKDDENAILAIKRLATSLLSAYELQRKSYKN